jgi:hypothetical protein
MSDHDGENASFVRADEHELRFATRKEQGANGSSCRPTQSVKSAETSSVFPTVSTPSATLLMGAHWLWRPQGGKQIARFRSLRQAASGFINQSLRTRTLWLWHYQLRSSARLARMVLSARMVERHLCGKTWQVHGVHFTSPFRCSTSTVEVRRQFRDQEWKLLHHVDAHVVFMLQLLAVR